MKLLLGTLVLLCVGLLATDAYALQMTTRNDVLILSGDSSMADVSPLKSALQSGIKTVVLDEVKGRDFADAWALANVIQNAKVTTVARGMCNYNCVRIFLSGQERMFSDSEPLRRTVLFIAGNAQEYDSSGVMYTDASHVASFIGMPRNEVEKWAFREAWGAGTNSFSTSFMLVYHPSIKIMNGSSLIGCPAGTSGKDMKQKCSAIDELDALSAKIITTNELFKIPE